MGLRLVACKWPLWLGLGIAALLLVMLGCALRVHLLSQLTAGSNVFAGMLAICVALLALGIGAWAIYRYVALKQIARAHVALSQLGAEVLDKIWLLSNNFAHPLRELAWMANYRRENKADELDELQQRLVQLQLPSPTAADVNLLATLRKALNYASSVAVKLREWQAAGHSHPHLVKQLCGHRQALARALEAFYGDAHKVMQLPHVELGHRLESQLRRSGPTALGDASIYTCYCYKPWHDPHLDMPYLVVVQLESPFSAHIATTVLLQKDHQWRNADELEQLIHARAEPAPHALAQDERSR